MKNCIKTLILAIFVAQFGFSQKSKKSIYFPQEQLIHPDCKNETNKNACLDNVIEERLLLILNLEKTKRLFYEDTLNVSINFYVDKKGEIIEDFMIADYKDEVITPRLKETSKYYFKQLPNFKIKNRKPRPYNSKHTFDYQYIVNYNNGKSLNKVEIPFKYEGGIIFEVPVFPGCKRTNDWKDRECFNQKMKAHISQNFRYPEEAQLRGIQGKTNVLFIIQKDGSVGHLKTKEGDPLLQKEAARIMSVLPKFKPALRNGEPVRVPFSIPITFKLQ